jgi:hypothetical protein
MKKLVIIAGVVASLSFVNVSAMDWVEVGDAGGFGIGAQTVYQLDQPPTELDSISGALGSGDILDVYKIHVDGLVGGNPFGFAAATTAEGVSLGLYDLAQNLIVGNASSISLPFSSIVAGDYYLSVEGSGYYNISVLGDTPGRVPEPAILADLLGMLGLLGFGAWRKVRKN